MTIKESCFLNSSTFATKNSECSSSRTEYNQVGRYSSNFKQKVANEVQLGYSKNHIARKYGLCRQTLSDWTKEACNPTPKIKKPEKGEKYSPDFKQKVVNEVQLGYSKNHIARKYGLCRQTLSDWTKEACNPTPKIKKPEKGEKYSPDFKQKVVNEVQLGYSKNHVARKYGLSRQTLSDWTKEACNPTPKIKKPEKGEKYSPDFKQKVISEVCLGESHSKVAKKYQICRRTISKWTKEAPKIRIPEKAKKYSPDFKQKVISEVCCLGKKKSAYVARKYQISYTSVTRWTRKALLPVKPTPVIKEPLEKETHPLEFKQKVIKEVCSGQHISQVCKNYNLHQNNLYIWLEQAYSPNFPYNSSAAWIDKS